MIDFIYKGKTFKNNILEKVSFYNINVKTFVAYYRTAEDLEEDLPQIMFIVWNNVKLSTPKIIVSWLDFHVKSRATTSCIQILMFNASNDNTLLSVQFEY